MSQRTARGGGCVTAPMLPRARAPSLDRSASASAYPGDRDRRRHRSDRTARRRGRRRSRGRTRTQGARRRIRRVERRRRGGLGCRRRSARSGRVRTRVLGRPRALLRLPVHAPAGRDRRRGTTRCCAWPEATILRPVQRHAAATQLWLLTGVEPARAWQAFAGEFIDVALREDITGFVALGSMMSDVPHTRPISVFAGSENEQVRDTPRARAQHLRGSGRHPRAFSRHCGREPPASRPRASGRACRTTSRDTRRRPRRRSRCWIGSRTSRARTIAAWRAAHRGRRVGGVDRRRRRRRRGDDRVHPPARAHPRHVGLPRGIRRRDRPGVRALPRAAAATARPSPAATTRAAAAGRDARRQGCMTPMPSSTSSSAAERDAVDHERQEAALRDAAHEERDDRRAPTTNATTVAAAVSPSV